MPIFMDLHIVPGISAEGAAEAHIQDLKIQHEFGCTCMTYWVDESRDSAFCLIEAPNEHAVRSLHNKAHGLTAHQIIEVNGAVVESFLGRIYDPETPDIPEGKLKVFNDPAFRILVLLKTVDPAIMAAKMGTKISSVKISTFTTFVNTLSATHGGEIAEHSENLHILSFRAATNAVNFSLELSAALTQLDSKLFQLDIALNAGVPVGKSKRIFGDVIEAGKNLLYATKANKIVTSGAIRDLLNKASVNEFNTALRFLSEKEEKLLSSLFSQMEILMDADRLNTIVLAESLNISKSSLNRTTTLLTGKSPNELIRTFRMNKAIKLLRSLNSDISSVAYQSGFKNPAYFSSSFKTYFGVSPSGYLSALRS
jgi:AraC-like DNA-binding protein